MVQDLFLWFKVKCVQSDNGIIQATQGYMSASHFCSWYAVENARWLFKGLYKLSKNLLYSHPTTIHIRSYASEIDLFPGVWKSVRVWACKCAGRCLHSELPAWLSWWAPWVAFFLVEIICIMGKWFESKPIAALAWGQSVEWKSTIR